MMLYVVVGAFMIMDIITGFVQAIKNKSVNSTVFRDGMYKKVGSVAIVLFGTLVDYCQTMVDIGFSVNCSLTFSIAIIIMESISILENIGNLNPDLVKFIEPYLEKISNK